ncbi:F-box protein [Senna tora]|uniref:F-box protein n=1 Tax=Senna tora TaxID=362788 RepID=A0A834TBU4_9FABA|nr:F-box protein [Senna tora]
MENKKEGNISLLDLPESILDYILKQFSPMELCTTSEVCTSLRNKCSSNDLWEEHIKRKWDRVIGHGAYKEWECHITTAKQENPLRIDEKGSLGSFYGDWPNLSLGSYLENCQQLRGSLSNYFMKALYLCLEGGTFWFPSQLYRYQGVLLICQDVLLQYDSKTDTFEARQQHGDCRCIRKNLRWDMVRAPQLEIDPYQLHVSCDLHNLHPGDHIEIQFRANNRQTPFDWWYAVVGHLDTCDKKQNQCGCDCDQSEMVVVEFKHGYAYPGTQTRRLVLKRSNNGEEDDGRGYFYGGIRKIQSEQEIDTWNRLFRQSRVLQQPPACILRVRV